MRLKRFTRLLVVLPLLLLGMSVTTAASAAADPPVQMTGLLRLAHLSPNTPAVDVYLYAFGNPSAKVVLHHVSYGTVSAYQPVPAGQYTAAMRLAGAAPTSQPVLSASASIAAGHAYTAAGTGPKSGLRIQLLPDQTTAPSGKVLVRVIQASLVQHVVSVSFNGKMLDPSLAFSSVSAYQPVTPGTGTLAVKGGTGSAHAAVSLASGSVHTLVVLDGPKGLVIDNLLDSSASSASGTVTVQPGDTLWAIARRYLGNGADWIRIYSVNRALIGVNPNEIVVGQHLQVVP